MPFANRAGNKGRSVSFKGGQAAKLPQGNDEKNTEAVDADSLRNFIVDVLVDVGRGLAGLAGGGLHDIDHHRVTGKTNLNKKMVCLLV